MICRQCNGENADTSRYCAICGAPLTETAVPEQNAEAAGNTETPKKNKQKTKLSPLKLAAIGAAVLALAVVLYLILRGTPAEAIRLTSSEMSVKVGTTCRMTYKLTPKDSDDELTWTSSDERVATVEDGVLTAIAEGDCVITVVTDSGCKDLCYLRIQPPLRPQEKEATGVRHLYASMQNDTVTYYYGSTEHLSLYRDMTGYLSCPGGAWELTWSYSHTEAPHYYFDAELADGTKATITYDADTGHSMHGVVSILLENGTLWSFK